MECAFMLDQFVIGREEAILWEQGAGAVCAEGDARFMADREVHQRRSDGAVFLSPQVFHDVNFSFQAASPRMRDIRANASKDWAG